MTGYTTNSCNTVWIKWNCGTTANTSPDTTTNGPWYQWCTTGTSTSTNTITQNCWNTWTSNAGTSYVRVASAPYVAPAETEEQRTARLARDEQYRKERDAAERKRKAAEKRAEELFHEHLTEPQRKEVKEKRHFHVISETGKRYRIHTDSGSGNVSELGEDGKVAQRYCAHPYGVPKFDQILAQKLALEVCENEFLRVANRCG